jgi:hypothetical protein
MSQVSTESASTIAATLGVSRACGLSSSRRTDGRKRRRGREQPRTAIGDLVGES